MIYLIALQLLFKFQIYKCDSSSVDSGSSSSGDKTPLQRLSEMEGITEQGIDRDNIDLDSDLNLTCEKLIKLDASLTKIFKEIPEGWGDEIVKQLKVYNTACLDLLELLGNTDKLKVLDAAEEILEPGGPTFFGVELDEQKMRKKFDWDDEQMDEFNGILKSSYDHWRSLDKANNNFNIG